MNSLIEPTPTSPSLITPKLKSIGLFFRGICYDYDSPTSFYAAHHSLNLQALANLSLAAQGITSVVSPEKLPIQLGPEAYCDAGGDLDYSRLFGSIFTQAEIIFFEQGKWSQIGGYHFLEIEARSGRLYPSLVTGRPEVARILGLRFYIPAEQTISDDNTTSGGGVKEGSTDGSAGVDLSYLSLQATH